MISRREFLKQGARLGVGLSLFRPFESAAATPQQILVIGAGISGLAAAATLKSRGHNVVVLEGRDRIGGRIWTDRTFSGGAVDLGASWIHGHVKNPLTPLAKKYGITTLVTEDQRRTDASFRKVQEDAYERQAELAAGTDEPLGIAFEKSLAANVGTPAQRQAIRHLISAEIENDYAADTSALSLRYWDKGTYFKGEDLLFPAGFGQVVTALAQGLDVRLSRVVSKIESTPHSVKVTTTAGEVFKAGKAIVTLPLGVLKKRTVTFSPELPPAKARAIEGLRMGTLDKVYLHFDKSFWPEKPTWLEHVGENAKSWPLFLNVRKYTGKPVLMAFNAGEFAEALEQKSDAEITAEAMAVLRTLYGKTVPPPIAVKITRWHADPFCFGSYSHIPVGRSPADMEALGDPVGQTLFFAGEATNGQHYGTAHGAYLSGLKAAESLMA